MSDAQFQRVGHAPLFAVARRACRLVVDRQNRVEEEHELLDLGWDDYLERGGLVIVEWPALHPELLPKGTRWLELKHHEDGRLIEVVEEG